MHNMRAPTTHQGGVLWLRLQNLASPGSGIVVTVQQLWEILPGRVSLDPQQLHAGELGYALWESRS